MLVILLQLKNATPPMLVTLDAGGLDAFQRFVNKLPEGCELRVSNLEFQPLRTLARAGVKPLPGRLSFYPDRQAALADL